MDSDVELLSRGEAVLGGTCTSFQCDSAVQDM